MKCIDELQKIGIDNIAAKTRITQEKLQNIIDLKFDAFNITRARGFMQIIEREFHIDLSEWFKAYNDYHNANTEHNTEQSEHSVDEIVNSINIPIDGDKQDKSYIVLIVILIVLAALFVGFFVYNNFLQNPTTTQSNATSSIKSTTQSTIVPSDSAQDIEQNQMDLAQQQSQDSDLSDSNALESNVDSTQNAQNMSESAKQNIDSMQDNATINPSENNATQSAIPSITQLDELVITPNEPLWVGIIDLKTHRKKQLSIDARHSITLDGDKLIRTGHSYFSVSSGTNFAKQFVGGDNKYLLYRVDSGISEISKAEFLELNKGQEW